MIRSNYVRRGLGTLYILMISSLAFAQHYSADSLNNNLKQSRIQGDKFNKTRQLRNTNLDLAHVLDRVSGVKVREDGGLGSGTSINLNGFTGKHVKLFIDGVPMEGAASSFGINNIPASFANSIEVYKGVVPVGNIHDYIIRTIGQKGVAVSTNHGKILGLGVDLGAHYYYKDVASFGGSYSIQNTRNKERLNSIGAESVTYNDRVPNLPYAFGGADASYTFKHVLGKANRLTIGWNMRYVHRFFRSWASEGAKLYVPEQLSHDANVTYSIQDGRYNDGATFGFWNVTADGVKLDHTKTIWTEDITGNGQQVTFSSIIDNGDGTFLTAMVQSDFHQTGTGDGSSIGEVKYPDSCWVAKMDRDLNVLKVYRDDRISYAAGQYRSQVLHEVHKADDGTVYVFSNAFNTATTRKAGRTAHQEGRDRVRQELQVRHLRQGRRLPFPQGIPHQRQQVPPGVLHRQGEVRQHGCLGQDGRGGYGGTEPDMGYGTARRLYRIVRMG